MSTIQKQTTSTAQAGPDPKKRVMPTNAHESRYHQDRFGDLRDAMKELLDPQIPLAESDLATDWRLSCADLGISPTRIESASPAELLRQLETRGEAVRDMIVVDGQRVKSVHWAARGYVSASTEKAKTQRDKRERVAKTIVKENGGARQGVDLDSLARQIAAIRADLDRVEALLRGLRK